VQSLYKETTGAPIYPWDCLTLSLPVKNQITNYYLFIIIQILILFKYFFYSKTYSLFYSNTYFIQILILFKYLFYSNTYLLFKYLFIIQYLFYFLFKYLFYSNTYFIQILIYYSNTYLLFNTYFIFYSNIVVGLMDTCVDSWWGGKGGKSCPISRKLFKITLVCDTLTFLGQVFLPFPLL
jgi:hypothetical protein